MKTLLLFILTATLALIAGACSATTDDQIETELRTAEMAIARGDMKAARSVASHLSDGKKLTGLSSRQLGRLSLVYMQLADQEDQAENVSSAIGCYRKAFEVDSDSATEFYNNVAAEHTPRAMVLRALTHAQDNAADSLSAYNDEPDSIDYDDITIPETLQ